MELIELIESVAKEGTDLSEIKAQVNGLNPLASLKTKEDAWKFVTSNDLLLSTYDQKQRERSDKAVDNYKSGKMQEEWKAREEELRKQYNPEETESDKKMRELEEKLAAMDNDKLLSDLKSELSKKAKELDFDTIKAQDYAAYGEKAMEKLESDAKWFKEELENRLGSKLKEKYKGNPPPRAEKPEPADLDKQIREARAAGDSGKALRLQLMKNNQKQS